MSVRITHTRPFQPLKNTPKPRTKNLPSTKRKYPYRRDTWGVPRWTAPRRVSLKPSKQKSLNPEPLNQALSSHRSTFHPVIKSLSAGKLIRLDLTASNVSLATVGLTDTAAFDRWVQQQRQGKVGIGGYLEDRVVYRRSDHYAGEDPRSLHLGLDLWTDAGTPVHAPLPGTVHSVADNQGFGNYGPTIILKHHLAGHTFFTLYGHLSRISLALWSVGQTVAAGTVIGEIGPYPENGDWPPHLHLQLITDRLDREQSDYPGVVAPAQRNDYATRCPDPRALLVILN